ncbi:MAG: zinc-finger domain-containing protein [Gammaproteobacteria bacterium]
MTDTQTSDTGGDRVPNAQNQYEVTKDDLPLHCPMDGMRLWDSHPKVYIPMDSGHGKCPYCGAEFTLK